MDSMGCKQPKIIKRKEGQWEEKKTKTTTDLEVQTSTIIQLIPTI
jgi:hypothetical protein